MKLFLPKNIFSSIFVSTIPSEAGFEIVFKESALICRELETDTTAVALIPSLELINQKTLFISKHVGFSLDGVLSNAYLTFDNNGKKISKLKIRGDISVNEIVLAKILFSERYSSEIEISLDTAKEKNSADNYLIVGDENFISGNYKTSISFSDQIAELIDLPYVNFVFVSKDKESLEKFNSIFHDIDLKIEDELQTLLSKLNIGEETKNFISENIGAVYFEMTQNEVNAINELIKLVYYHGIIDDIFDLKFV